MPPLAQSYMTLPELGGYAMSWLIRRSTVSSAPPALVLKTQTTGQQSLQGLRVK